MKKNVLLFLSIIMIATSAMAQKMVDLHINHLLNGEPMAFMKTVPSPTGGYFFKVETLRYYVSGIKITHDGGKVTEAKNVYILVNPATSGDTPLGMFDVTNVEAIEFSIGVDKVTNHLDPTTYPTTHSLAMQNPTMHWGWTSGYRFVAIEGYAGATAATATNNFQIHTLDDKLYKAVKIPTTAENHNGHLKININAEYKNLLKSISAATGVISHGSTGASLTLTNNFISSVFTAKSSVGVEDLMTLDVAVYPNPATSQVVINAPISGVDNQEVTITNIAGQVVLKAQKSSETLQLALSLSAGNYMVSIAENGKTIGKEKLVIVE